VPNYNARQSSSESIDDYLKAIFEIAGDEDRASTASIARKLEVAPASVTGMLRKLAEQHPPWVAYEKHKGAVLTEHGRRRALEVIRHHRLLELFLHNSLGYKWDEVHAEAEKLEHAISETFEDRIAEQMGNPEVDPHGHPIPRKDGTMPKRVDVRILDLPPGATGIVSRVSDHDGELLRYLASLGIRPGVQIEFVERQPFEGPLMVRIAQAAVAQALGARVCSEIRVSTTE